MNELSENYEDQEKDASIFMECPHCFTKILPHADNTCPACQGDLSSLVGVNPNKVSFLIHESEELPLCCYSCGQYTEQEIRVSGDQESILSKFLTGDLSPEQTSNVIIFLPQCQFCAEIEDPEPVEVDYEKQTMTFAVHTRFRDQVIQLREDFNQNEGDAG